MKVKFLPQGIEIPITPEKTLLQAALENGVDVKSICKGKLICAECRVKVVDGENSLVPPSKAELNLLGTSWQLDGRRFACQIRCFGDATFDLTEQVQRAESQRKNIRGFKSSKPVAESQAVIDTMLLNEKIEVSDEGRAPRGGRPNEPRPAISGEGEAGKAESNQRHRRDNRNNLRKDGAAPGVHAEEASAVGPNQAQGQNQGGGRGGGGNGGGRGGQAGGSPNEGGGQGGGGGGGRSRRGGRGRNRNNNRDK